ncbi:MAG TPA: hypothetical protein PLQ76_02120, partial [bacterium]|nr:hypothetical protein [bacterium]
EGREYYPDILYDPTNGARPVRRLVQKYIEDPLSEKLLLCKYTEGETFKVRLDEGLVVVQGDSCKTESPIN